jgi:hypothetical protein
MLFIGNNNSRILIDLVVYFLYFSFPVLPYETSENFDTSFASSSSADASLFQISEDEHLEKVRSLHVNYRTQIQELQAQGRRNERHIQDMERASRDDMKELIYLHDRIRSLEGRYITHCSFCSFISPPINVSFYFNNRSNSGRGRGRGRRKN